MPTFKNIRIKMKGGGSRLQRIMVLASGKYKFVKNITKSRSKKTGKSKKTTRRYRKVAKKRKRGTRKFTLPMAPIIGLMVGLAPAIEPILDGDIEGAVNKLKFNYLGLTHDNQFDVHGLWAGLFPLVLGGLVHKFVGGAPLNINRMLANANVPVVRI